MTILISFLVFMAYMTLRNELVYRERVRTSKVIFAQENWEYYLNLKHKTSYERMLFRFWVFPIHRMWVKELQDLIKESVR